MSVVSLVSIFFFLMMLLLPLITLLACCGLLMVSLVEVVVLLVITPSLDFHIELSPISKNPASETTISKKEELFLFLEAQTLILQSCSDPMLRYATYWFDVIRFSAKGVKLLLVNYTNLDHI